MSSPFASPPAWQQYDDVAAQRRAYAEYQRVHGVDFTQSLVDAKRLFPQATDSGRRGVNHPSCDRLPTIDTTDAVARDRALIERCSARSNPFNH